MSKQLTLWCVGRFAQFPRVILAYAFHEGDQADFGKSKTWVLLRLDLHLQSLWARGEQFLKYPQVHLHMFGYSDRNSSTLSSTWKLLLFLFAVICPFACVCPRICLLEIPLDSSLSCTSLFLALEIISECCSVAPLVESNHSPLAGVKFPGGLFFLLSTQYSHISHLML